jgi:hypothetical protein
MFDRLLIMRIIFGVALLLVFGIALTWYLDRSDDELVDRVNNSTPLQPDGGALQRRVDDALSQRLAEKEEDIVESQGFSDSLNTMQQKLTGMIKALSTRQPTEAELQAFFEDRRIYYGGGARVEFLYRPFLSVKYGGRAFEVAQQALDDMISGNVPLLKDRRLSDDGYFFGFYKPDENEAEEERRLEQAFGPQFKDQLIALINETPRQLPCWDGPISGTHGVYLVCVKKHLVEPFATLDEVREEVINDWRLSTVRRGN